MMKIGRINRLRIVKEVDFGLYLDGGDKEQGGFGEILLPIRYVPTKYAIDDMLDVFIYVDSEDRIIATTEKPFAMVGEFALLKVASINPYGIFFNWGLPKDLLLPFNEQFTRMDEGKSYVVRIFLDEKSNRIAASAKINRFLHDENEGIFEEGQEVSFFNAAKTDLGYKIIINNSHWGLLHQHELVHDIRRGEHLTGYIKRIREDDRIDLCLHQLPSEKSGEVADDILDALEKAGGFLAVNDKSSPDEIKAAFKISKRVFKKAIGMLYRQHKITLETDGIRLGGSSPSKAANKHPIKKKPCKK